MLTLGAKITFYHAPKKLGLEHVIEEDLVRSVVHEQ